MNITILNIHTPSKLILALVFSLLHVAGPMEISRRITGGQLAKEGQFPWQVVLKKTDSEDSTCGASLISSTWVLTAAHCLNDENELFLMFGTVQLVNHNALNMTSSELYAHPNYNREHISNDVGLIKLPQPVNFTSNIKAISLPPTSYELDDFFGLSATTSGFGLKDDTTLKNPTELYYTELKIISNDKCAKELKQPIDNGTMCAKAQDHNQYSSVCNGDSGSAMVQKDENGDWLQIGIISFVAEGMCTKGYPAGFARITKFLEWIANLTDIELT